MRDGVSAKENYNSELPCQLFPVQAPQPASVSRYVHLSGVHVLDALSRL